MTKFLAASAAIALMAGSANAASHANEVKIGILLGFTGPAESLATDMAAGAEAAAKEISESGLLLGGATVTTTRGDSTCIDAGAATAAAERLITAEGVDGLIGALCSGATGAAFSNVSLPNGMVQISPSATSPGLTDIVDEGLFFRTSPSDAQQGVVMSDILLENGITEVAVTYTNNDYGKGLADAFESAYTAAGGSVTINIPHEDGKADYSAEVANLASAGGQKLVVAGYLDQGGPAIIEAALDTGAFEDFHLPDAMIGDSIEARLGARIEGATGQVPGSPNADLMTPIGEADGYNGTAPYAPESYDAMALMLLAMQAAGSTDPAVYKDFVMNVANAPGEPINPGELAKALQILADGGEIDYVGGSAVELIEPGESAGSYRQFVVEGGVFETVGFRQPN